MFARMEKQSIGSMSESMPISTSVPRLEPMPESVSSRKVSALGASARDVAKRHSRLLLASLISELSDEDDRTFSVHEMMTIYGEWCAEQNLLPRPWNSVAASLAKIISMRGRPVKTYHRFVDCNGRDRRRRCYEIPRQVPP